jgi:hypothetical protein
VYLVDHHHLDRDDSVMSRLRVGAKVRKNPDFDVVARELDRLGLSWTLNPATGKGHPMLHIIIGGTVYRRPVSCTPGARTPQARFLGDVRRWLRERGVGV